MGCVNLRRIARGIGPSYAGVMNGALDRLEQAIGTLEAAVARLEAQGDIGGSDARLRAEVAEVIAELDAMLGAKRG
jgi:hypothetical protein